MKEENELIDGFLMNIFVYSTWIYLVKFVIVNLD